MNKLICKYGATFMKVGVFAGILSVVCLGNTVKAQGGGDIPDAIVNTPAQTAWWQGQYFKARISKRFFYYHEVHMRRINSLDNRLDFAGRAGQIYNRPGLTYLVNKNFEVTLGAVTTVRFSPDPSDDNLKRAIPDLRIWHQYLFAQKMGRFKFLHQFRVEHRWLSGFEKGSETNYTNRWRYKIAMYIPLNKPQMEDKTWYLYPSNEFFFESGPKKLSLFEENRLYVAAGYTYGNWQFFVGWMYTYGPNQQEFWEYRTRHILRTNIALNLDLRKDKKLPSEGILLPY